MQKPHHHHPHQPHNTTDIPLTKNIKKTSFKPGDKPERKRFYYLTYSKTART